MNESMVRVVRVDESEAARWLTEPPSKTAVLLDLRDDSLRVDFDDVEWSAAPDGGVSVLRWPVPNPTAAAGNEALDLVANLAGRVVAGAYGRLSDADVQASTRVIGDMLDEFFADPTRCATTVELSQLAAGGALDAVSGSTGDAALEALVDAWTGMCVANGVGGVVALADGEWEALRRLRDERAWEEAEEELPAAACRGRLAGVEYRVTHLPDGGRAVETFPYDDTVYSSVTAAQIGAALSRVLPPREAGLAWDAVSSLVAAAGGDLADSRVEAVVEAAMRRDEQAREREAAVHRRRARIGLLDELGRVEHADAERVALEVFLDDR